MFVKPREGYSIPDPTTGTYIPAEGREVPDGDIYWMRRLRDGDVVKADQPQDDNDGENA